MVQVDNITIRWFYSCSQYQLCFAFILMRYSDLTSSSPALITFPSVIVYYFNVKAPATYFTM